MYHALYISSAGLQYTTLGSYDCVLMIGAVSTVANKHSSKKSGKNVSYDCSTYVKVTLKRMFLIVYAVPCHCEHVPGS